MAKKMKKEMLKDRLHEYIDSVLDMAEHQGKLDHFNIEISNHNGNLQMDNTMRNREKAY